MAAGNRFVVLLLGLWVALAPAFSTAPAVAMAAQAGMSDDGGCHDGDCGPEGDIERGLCKLMCLNAGQMAITVEPTGMTADVGGYPGPDRFRGARDYVPAPDPSPPKAIALL